jgi:Ni,Fe-hydrogenase III component G
MTREEELQQKIREQFGDRIAVTIARPRRVTAVTLVADLKPALRWLKDSVGYYHLSTITGLDRGENFEALYHLNNGDIELTLRTAVPRTDPHLPTITDIIAGAILYERELQDMFGFVVDGIPDSRRYVLPEDWPDGVYPLRKDYKYVPAGDGDTIPHRVPSQPGKEPDAGN